MAAYPQIKAKRDVERRSTLRTSSTWTSTGDERGHYGLADETDRSVYVDEYNRLAKLNDVRELMFENVDFQQPEPMTGNPQRRSWLFRMLRSSSNQLPGPQTSDIRVVQYKRSVSDLALHLTQRQNDATRTMELQDMIRIGGKSLLYLPAGYAPSALLLPTGIRATAHYIAQHVTTRGIFRIPGSVRIVSDLFDYYCSAEDGQNVTGTARSADVPLHIDVCEHDVASAFKRMLYVLPGGILGSLTLFDTFVAIHSRFHHDPEFPRTKHTMVRARLIALAIASIDSSARRDLICAVFGLLNLIGRVAEITPREDQGGRPCPTGELMGYNGLGIIFGPLLVGNLLEKHAVNTAPDMGASPRNSPKTNRNSRKLRGPGVKNSGPALMDKILVANSITEMLITNWRDVVRQMKSLSTYHRNSAPSIIITQDDLISHPDTNSLAVEKPQDVEKDGEKDEPKREDDSPTSDQSSPTLSVPKHRLKSARSSISKPPDNSPLVLVPSIEEVGSDDDALEAMDPRSVEPTILGHVEDTLQTLVAQLQGPNRKPAHKSHRRRSSNPVVPFRSRLDSVEPVKDPLTLKQRRKEKSSRSPRVSLDSVPPRTSSKFKTFGEGTQGWRSPKQSISDVPRTSSIVETEPVAGGLLNRRKPEELRSQYANLAGIISFEFQDAASMVPLPSSGSTEPSSPTRVSVIAMKAFHDDVTQPESLQSPEVSRRPESGSHTILEQPLSDPGRRPSDLSMGSASHDGEYVYRVDNKIEQMGTDISPDNVDKTPFESTPRQFYAPMMVPPDISTSLPTPNVTNQGKRPSEVHVDS